MTTSAMLTIELESLKQAQIENDEAIKSTREILRTQLAGRDVLAEQHAIAKKARFAAIDREAKEEKIAALKAQLAALENDLAPAVALVA
jgi:hypothetical protein